MQRYPMTVQGAEALKAELNKLKFTDRPAVVAAIAEARAHGDLKENAEYHAAREQQGFIEGRLQDIEGKLSNAQVIDIKQMPHTGKVIFGATVDIENIDTGEAKTYHIVGDDEADFKIGKISVNSPIARGLIGKSKGEEALIETPGGTVEYEVVAVRYE
jgi:transcription elongation factor GreA